ncbi:MAG: sigma-70 family RNA polymerase sigma factor [Myxococcota bacterium]
MGKGKPRSQRCIDPDLGEAYREHYGFVWRSLRRLGVPDDLVDDAVHDVFVVAARRLREFEGRAKITSWLFAVAVRVSKHQRRARARHRRRKDALAAELAAVAPPQGGEIDRQDAARTLHALLQQLEEGLRHVFILMELEQMTGREVAEILGLSVPTAHSRLRSARQQLRRHAEALQSDPVRRSA